MYNSQYYTCEQIDERLLQGYLDDYNSQTGQSLTKAQFLTKLGSLFSKEGTIDNTLTQIGYYECDTAAGTAAKVINVVSYSLFAGGSMKVKFVNKNTANNATLNINSQGAKALYYNGVRVSSTNTWDAGEVVEIYYDGTSYYANNVKGSTGDGVFDISVYNPTEGQPTPYADLASALGPNGQNVPVQYRKGGMSVKFVQSSDNKYVRFNLVANEFTTDITKWEYSDDGIYISDPVWLWVLIDKDKRLLGGWRKDGKVEWSDGVPTPIKEYLDTALDTAIASIMNGSNTTSIDGLNKVIAFLNNYNTTQTLKQLFDGKVDKEENKSLIPTQYIQEIEDIHHIDAIIDKNKRQIGGIGKNDIDVYLPVNFASQIQSPTFNVLRNELREQDCLMDRKYLIEDSPYYFTEPENPVSYDDGPYLDIKIKNTPKGSQFIFVTDTHWPDNANGQPNNAKKSNLLIDYVRKRLNIKTVVFGGDALNSGDTKYEVAKNLSSYADETYSAFGKSFLWVQGNHDRNFGGKPREAFIDAAESIKRTIAFNEDVLILDDELLNYFKVNGNEEVYNWAKFHYAYDDKYNKIRFIVFETGDLGLQGEYLGTLVSLDQIQLPFVYKCLISCPEDYNIVFIGHQMGHVTYGESAPTAVNLLGDTGIKNVLQMLSAYKTKTNITVKGSGGMTAMAYNYWGGYQHERIFNFENVKYNKGLVLCLGGHFHCDNTWIARYQNGEFIGVEYGDDDTYTKDSVLVIWTNRDAFNRPESQAEQALMNHAVVPVMTQGTVTEQCFDVVTITDGKVICTRYGAGNDRVYNL